MRVVNKFLSMALLGALFLVAQQAGAESNPGIAVIDVQTVIERTDAAGKALSQIKSEADKAQQKLTEMEKALMNREKDLGKKKAVLSEEKFLEEQDKLRGDVRAYHGEREASQAKLDRMTRKLKKEIADEVRVVVEELAKERGYQIVAAKSFLFYRADEVDISEEVLKRVNKRLAK